MGLMLLILTTSIFTSCKPEPKPEPKVYTVTFDAAGGSEVAAIQVKSGEKAVQPDDPVKEGYVFDAWYNGEAVYDWETPVTANLTLIAKWTDKTYTVTFDVEGIDAQEIKHKDKVTKPEAPTKEGCVFAGWLNGETAYDFELPVTSDLVLTASWEVIKYSITFDSDGGSEVKAFEVDYETVANEPAAPTKEGHLFAGWFVGEVAYDWTAKVKENLTLKAKWKKALAGIFEFDTEYNGWQEWSMIENESKDAAGTATIAEPPLYLNVNVKDKGLKEKDTIKVEVKFASTEGLKQIGVLSAGDNYAWKQLTPNESNTYEVEFKLTKATFDNDLLGFWFVPQDGDGALIGKKYSLYYESIKVTHIPYVPEEGEEEVELNKVTVSEDGKVVTIENPTMLMKYGCTVEGNVINYSGNSAAAWTYENITDYSQVEIFYETTKESSRKIAVKAFGTNEGNGDVAYLELQTAGSINFNISNFVEKLPDSSFTHIGIANNANDNNWPNPKWDDDWTLKITKIVLTKVDQLEDKVIFDPATFTAPAGMEIVEKEGNKYLKVVPDGYNTTIAWNADVSGYTQVEFTIYIEEVNEEMQHVMKVLNGASSVCGENGVAVKTEKTGVVKLSASLDTGCTAVTSIQPIVQELGTWAAQTDKTMYIGKIVVKTN